MTHRLGRVVADGRTVTEASGIDLTPVAGPHGPVRFVMLHFDSVSLSGAAQLVVPLGYATDVFNASSGSTFWSRPVDISVLPIAIRISGGSGSARLLEFGSGEPDVPPGQTPGTTVGSLTDPDVFLQTSPYLVSSRVRPNLGSGGEPEHLHLIGVLSFDDEFREDVGCGGIQEKFRHALAQGIGHDEL